MARAFVVNPIVQVPAYTFNLGTKTEPLTDADVGKLVTLTAGSTLDLGGADDEIYGVVSSIEVGTSDGMVVGGVKRDDYVIVDTGSVPVGSLVVIDSQPAKGTAGLTKVKAAADPSVLKGSRWIVIHAGRIQRV